MPLIIVLPNPDPPPEEKKTIPLPPGSRRADMWTQIYTVPRPVLEFNVMRNDTHVNESPRHTTAGESLTMTWTFEGASACSNPSVAAYKGTTTVTSTLFPTNSPTASGNTVTFSPLTGMTGGDTYVVALTVTVDGSTRVVRLVVICAAASDL